MQISTKYLDILLADEATYFSRLASSHIAVIRTMTKHSFLQSELFFGVDDVEIDTYIGTRINFANGWAREAQYASNSVYSESWGRIAHSKKSCLIAVSGVIYNGEIVYKITCTRSDIPKFRYPVDPPATAVFNLDGELLRLEQDNNNCVQFGTRSVTAFVAPQDVVAAQDKAYWGE